MTTTIPKLKSKGYMYGGAYDLRLPNEQPFMYVEIHKKVKHKVLGQLGLLAYGAYNAMGLIGTEAGGVAVVLEDPKCVLATKDLPYSPGGRRALIEEIAGMIKKGNYVGDISKIREIFMADLRLRDFVTRDGL